MFKNCDNQNNILLQIKDVYKYFPVSNSNVFIKKKEFIKAVDGVNLIVKRGETLGLVGESGCGKTTLGKCIMRLYSLNSGSIFFCKENGKKADIFKFEKEESFIARRRIQMIFQDPYSSLNPTLNILSAFDEPLRIHGFGNRKKRIEIASEMMKAVNLHPEYLYRYPHEFSGGQRQRICIAKSLSLNPELIVCDEPVSALDVSIQAQIMNLMRKLQVEFGLTYIFIAHDLSVVKYMSDRIAVMYLGKIVEVASSDDLYNCPAHPYTNALISAVPIPKIDAKKEETVLMGDVPSPIDPPSGCRFHTRCKYCTNVCIIKEPPLIELENKPGHFAACHNVMKVNNE